MRKRELRGAPVVEGERSHRRRATQLTDEMPVTLQRAPDISPAVQIEDDLAGARDGRGRPFSGNTVRPHLFHTDIRCQREEVSQRVGRRPTLFNGAGCRQCAKHGFKSFKLIHRKHLFQRNGPQGRLNRHPTSHHERPIVASRFGRVQNFTGCGPASVGIEMSAPKDRALRTLRPR
jgi:hypothetical protein